MGNQTELFIGQLVITPLTAMEYLRQKTFPGQEPLYHYIANTASVIKKPFPLSRPSYY